MGNSLHRFSVIVVFAENHVHRFSVIVVFAENHVHTFSVIVVFAENHVQTFSVIVVFAENHVHTFSVIVVFAENHVHIFSYLQNKFQTENCVLERSMLATKVFHQCIQKDVRFALSMSTVFRERAQSDIMNPVFRSN